MSSRSLDSTGRPVEGWVWPAPTKSGHVEASSIKKQHAKAMRLSGVRPFVLYKPTSRVPDAAGGFWMRCLDFGADSGAQFDCHFQPVRPPL
jgi:hypothetical protein